MVLPLDNIYINVSRVVLNIVEFTKKKTLGHRIYTSIS